jgi:hypothetical protein
MDPKLIPAKRPPWCARGAVGIGGVAVEALRSNFNLNGSNHRRTDHGRIVDQPEST